MVLLEESYCITQRERGKKINHKAGNLILHCINTAPFCDSLPPALHHPSTFGDEFHSTDFGKSRKATILPCMSTKTSTNRIVI